MTDHAADPPSPGPEPITLRLWESADLEDLIAIFRASDDLETQYPVPVRTLSQARECFEQMLTSGPQRVAYAIVVDGHCVGNVAISHLDRRHDTGWVSYFSSGAVRGRGLVRRSVTAVATWGLDELGLFRLELGHRVDNPASGAVARAAGFVAEGRERAKLRYGEQRYDTLTYARLATDPVPEPDPAVRLIEPAVS